MAYNKTQLNPDVTFERHVFHRDQFAHFLRWSHVLKRAKIGQKVLDFGCGSGNLAEVFYRNRYKLDSYIGLDISDGFINKAKKKFEKVEWVKFFKHDLVQDELDYGNDFDIITSFEVVEHIGKNNIDKFLINLKKHCNENTIVMISTPNYDEGVGAAKNHTYDSGNGVEVQEFEHNELKHILKNHFVIQEKYGTFASQKDYKNELNEWQKNMFDELSKYYDSNLISNIMAPMFPEKARNCIWILKAKQ